MRRHHSFSIVAGSQWLYIYASSGRSELRDLEISFVFADDVLYENGRTLTVFKNIPGLKNFCILQLSRLRISLLSINTTVFQLPNGLFFILVVVVLKDGSIFGSVLSLFQVNLNVY